MKEDRSINLILACISGNLEDVEYLLTTNHPDWYINIHSSADSALVQACKKRNLELIKFLLTSPKLKEHADIEKLTLDYPNLPYGENYLEMLKYLLKSPDLEKHVDVHAKKDYLFKKAIYASPEILNYLIFEYEIEETDEIKEHVKNQVSRAPEINKMFEMRELKKSLEINLIKEEYKVNNKRKV